MRMAGRIEAKLKAALAPTRIEVHDRSAAHAGHSGARPGGETHFDVEIESPAFAGLDALARHRAVNAALAEELRDGVHALAIKARAPGETW
ncbi:MAG: BolA family transcriptional regulator [Hyphomicrobiales bacterium]|nr:BolA family transcriptional regulator [Hyphomicrobiales bacterium]